MFERFTDRARRCVVLAQEESRGLRHNYIGPEHVLLGILAVGDSPGATALVETGFGVEGVRARITPGATGQDPSGHIPFTPAAKRTLEMSLREALKLHHNFIGTEHIVLGLLQVEDFAIEDLAPDGFDREELREAVLRTIGATSPATADEDPPMWRAPRRATDPWLRQLEARLRDVRRAKDEAIDARDIEQAVFLREQERALLANQANTLRRVFDDQPSTMVKGRVYLSYRVEDEGIAGRVHDFLARSITPAMVFMDAARSQPDRDPIEATMSAVLTSEYILVLIGPSWLDSRVADGQRHIDQVDDEVRLALLAAQGRGRTVIPLLVHGASQPTTELLPPAIAELATAEPLRLEHLSFAADMARLLPRIGHADEAA
jgi:ATP-dependent Clp protease ATP-binding subunit ClpC